MAKNRLKLFRLTKKGLRLVKEALMGYDSINGFYEKNKKFGVHRDTFTRFHNGEGVKRETIETYFNLLEISN